MHPSSAISFFTLVTALTVFTTRDVNAQGGLQPPPAPAGNPVTAEKTLLGKALFWDEQLSSTRMTACGTCHILNAGGSDPRSVIGNANSTHPGADGIFGTNDDVTGSPGVIRSGADGSYIADADFSLAPQVTPRRSMPAVNAGYPRSLFWDGRALEAFRDPITNNVILPRFAALESQALGPIESDVEMGHEGIDWSEVTDRLTESMPLAMASNIPTDLAQWIQGRSYPQLFAEAFGDPAITPVRIAFALATYQRGLYTDQAPIDDFLNGNTNALTAQERRGFNLFNSPQTGCNICHGGPLFSDNQFHYTGVTPQNEDLGLGGINGDPRANGLMKTPSLRNAELRGPFFHNGNSGTLADVVAFYNRGGNFNGPNKAPGVRPLGLNPQQQADLLAFLGRPLTDPRLRDGVAPFDSPTLFSQSNQGGQLFGQPTPGSAGFMPVMVALEPPMLRNPSMTIGLDRGMGGAAATLLVDRAPDFAGSPLRGATCYLDLSHELMQNPVVLAGSGAGNGTASLSFAVPNMVVLIGQNFYAQWFIEDANAPAGVSASSAVQFTMFRN
jgi:cytochrome c peroxidase